MRSSVPATFVPNIRAVLISPGANDAGRALRLRQRDSAKAGFAQQPVAGVNAGLP